MAKKFNWLFIDIINNECAIRKVYITIMTIIKTQISNKII
jgi:hypothetical protein